MSSWQVGPYILHSDGLFRLAGNVVPLSPLQRKLLVCFVRHAGKLIERPQLLQEVWGHANVSDVSLARAVHSLRHALDQGPLGGRVITTSYGSGYVFSAPVVEIQETSAAIDRQISSPSPLALEYYFHARVMARHLDPQHLRHARKLLELALQQSPAFSEALVFLISLHLHSCRWGLASRVPSGANLETLLSRAEQLNAPSEDWLPLRAETISLLHWQPTMVDETYGPWLPQTLGYGLPLLSWVRHLLATGRAHEGLTLLEPHLNGSIPIGWTLAAQLMLQMGQTKAAIEMLQGQLRIDGSLPATQLALAMVYAANGDRAAALNSLAAISSHAVPMRLFPALFTYVLARVGEMARAETLLKQAKAETGDSLGLSSLWGLNAVVLGQQELADHFFRLALHNRCYQAPFVVQSPLLAPYAQEPSVQSFRDQIVRFFPTLDSACSRQPAKPMATTDHQPQGTPA